MHIEKLSATSLQAAMLCLARYKAEYIDRGKGIGGTAANFGTCVHATLEMYVLLAYVKGSIKKEWDELKNIWKMQHAAHYGGLGENPEEFKLGEQILKRWFERGDLEEPGRKVVSLEQKKTFPIVVDGHTVTITYIIDRLDQDGDGAFRVVDYKTSAWNVTADQLREEKIQAAIYALATQIEHPDAPGIWVEFDMLKHENQPIGVYFKREDNEHTWVALKREIRKIIQAPDNPQPTLNNECLFCPAKVTCPAVLANAGVGGIMSLNREEMIDQLATLSYQESAAKAAQKELSQILLRLAKEEDTLQLVGTKQLLNVSMSKRREVDPERVEMILGPQLWDKYGSAKIALGTVDSLLKGTELTSEQKAQLRDVIVTNTGDPYLKPKARTALDGI